MCSKLKKKKMQKSAMKFDTLKVKLINLKMNQSE